MWHYTEGIANHSPVWAQHGIRILPGPSSMWFDATGQRLPVPLFPGFDTLGTLAHIGQTGHEHTWFIATHKIVEKEFALSGSEQNPDLTGKDMKLLLNRARAGVSGPVQAFLDRGEDFVVAKTLPELVAGMNRITGGTPELDLAQIEREVVARDREIEHPFTKDLQITAIRGARNYLGDKLIRVAPPHRLLDPEAGPLVAVRLNLLTRKSLGGLETDLSGRVLRPGGEVFPGLYAAGEVAGFGGGGMHGYRSLEGTFLGGCLFSGPDGGPRGGGCAVSTTRRLPWADPATQTQPGSPLSGAAAHGARAVPAAVRLPRRTATATRATATPVPGGRCRRGGRSGRAGHHQRRPGVRAGRHRAHRLAVRVVLRLGIASWRQDNPAIFALVPDGVAGHRGAPCWRSSSCLGRPPDRRRDPRAHRAPGAAWLLAVAAHGVQIVLAVYWAVRLVALMNERPGGRRHRDPGGGHDLLRRGAASSVWAWCCSPGRPALVREPAPALTRHAGDWAACPRSRPSTPPSPTLLSRDPAGLVAAVAQQHDTGEVLMLAWMDDEALHRTLTTGRATYWSRSRGEYWVKGETSGQPAVGARGARSTATATRCWCSSTRRAPPATPASAAASTGRCPPSRGCRAMRFGVTTPVPRGVRRARPARSCR